MKYEIDIPVYRYASATGKEKEFGVMRFFHSAVFVSIVDGKLQDVFHTMSSGSDENLDKMIADTINDIQNNRSSTKVCCCDKRKEKL